VEIDFGSDSTREVESRVYLSGAVIVWSTAPEPSLKDLLADDWPTGVLHCVRQAILATV
jgi:hypothetical protein